MYLRFLDAVFVGHFGNFGSKYHFAQSVSLSVTANPVTPPPVKLKSRGGQEPCETGGHDPSDQPMFPLIRVIIQVCRKGTSAILQTRHPGWQWKERARKYDGGKGRGTTGCQHM